MTDVRGAVGVITALGIAMAHAVPVVSNVQMQQRENSRVVDISYDLGNAPAIVTLGIETNGVAIPDHAVTRLSGDVAVVVQPGSARHIVWDAGADWPEHAVTNAQARVTAWTTSAPPLYMVVDLSSGAGAGMWPVSYHVSEEGLPYGGLTNDMYRTVLLAMRRIRTGAPYPENGAFMMGSPEGETGRESAREYYHQVTLTQDYYLGVFEVTQYQWFLVMDARPSGFANANHWMTRPVEKVSYNLIRGTAAQGGGGWPGDKGVHAEAFVGRLREKTGMAGFDLPTEAQWEYACRAGTRGALNNGAMNLTNASSDANMALVARYEANGGRVWSGTGWVNPSSDCTAESGTAKVGSYRPNAWGLYDMHGNVWEWCLDWYTANLGTVPVVDPKGAPTGSSRVPKGGCWRSDAAGCRSTRRYYDYTPGTANDIVGFRIARMLP